MSTNEEGKELEDEVEKTMSIQDIADELLEENETVVVKISDKKDDKHLNGFDIVFIKIWAFICAAITKLSLWIEKGIYFIFKKHVPVRYVTASVSVVLVILLLLALTLPFNINVTDAESIEIYSDGLIAVQKDMGKDDDGNTIYKWGYANSKGEIVISCKYSDALKFKYDVAFVQVTTTKSGSPYIYWKIINKKGKDVGSLKFVQIDEARPVQNFSGYNKLARVYVGGLYGYVNTSGKIAISPEFDSAEVFVDGIAKVVKGSYSYFINTKGKVVSDKYEDARTMSCERAAVNNNGRWGYIEKDGDLVIPAIYDAVSDFKDGYAAVKLGDTYGIIDQKGKAIVDSGLFTNIEILSYFNFS